MSPNPQFKGRKRQCSMVRGLQKKSKNCSDYGAGGRMASSVCFSTILSAAFLSITVAIQAPPASMPVCVSNSYEKVFEMLPTPVMLHETTKLFTLILGCASSMLIGVSTEHGPR